MRKVINIDSESHKVIKDYCDANHLILSKWIASVALKAITDRERVFIKELKHPDAGADIKWS